LRKRGNYTNSSSLYHEKGEGDHLRGKEEVACAPSEKSGPTSGVSTSRDKKGKGRKKRAAL